MSTEREKQIAYHEAGHAVMALINNISFRSVSVEPGMGREGVIDFDESILSSFDADAPLSDEQRARVESLILFALAGDTAEAIFLGGGELLDSQADELLAKPMTMYLNIGSLEECHRYLSAMRARAHEMLSQPARWAMVEALVKSLLTERTLDHQRVRALVSQV